MAEDPKKLWDEREQLQKTRKCIVYLRTFPHKQEWFENFPSIRGLQIVGIKLGNT